MITHKAPDSPIIIALKKWKRDQGIISLTLEEMKEKSKDLTLIIEQKVDGQSSIVDYRNGKAIFGSLHGVLMEDLPVLDEIISVFKKNKISQARIVGEMAGNDKGKILPFEQTESIIKNSKSDKNKIHWYPYQILELNNKSYDNNFKSYKESWPEIKKLFDDSIHIHPVKYYEGGIKDLEKAWKTLVEKEKNEGIVIRTSDNKVYKIKPLLTYDLVVVAVGDKKLKNWSKGLIGNTLMAFMDNNRVFRTAGEVGTGWTEEQRRELFKWASKNKVDEDNTHIWVKPMKIMEVELERSNIKDMKAYKYERGKYIPQGKKPSVTIVKPRFLRYRTDKSVNPSDLRLEQSPAWSKKEKMARSIVASLIKKPDLILTIGIPGSGKSFWIKSMSGFKVVSPDSIRAELSDISDQSVNPQAWAIAKKRVSEYLKQGKNVILDATNLISFYRKSFLEELPPHNLKAKIFKIDPETAKKRIKEDIQKGRLRAKVPDNVVDMMYEDFKKTVHEGELENEGFEILGSKTAGWWKIDTVEKGQIDFKNPPEGRKLLNALPGIDPTDHKYNGDGPADIMDDAVKKIFKQYRDSWKRAPKRDEMKAVFNFCTNNIQFHGEEKDKTKTIKMAQRIASQWVFADYPDHPDDIVIHKSESILGNTLKELDIWSYYEGIKSELIKELKGNDLFIAIKPEGILKKGQKPVYIRHPYDKKTEFIRINNDKEFEEYHSGRTVEYHITMPSMAPYFIVDFDAMKDFGKAKSITGEIADKLKKHPDVKSIDIHYTGKRGFHVFGWLKKAKPIDNAREELHTWLKENFSDHKDVVIGESPKGSKGALGLSPMKFNGGHISKWSMRVSGLCCVEVPRASLSSFERSQALPERVYKKLAGKAFKREKEPKVSKVISEFINDGYDIVAKAGYDRKKLEPGYKGKFVIQKHTAERAGKHFDVRLEFPVISLSRSLHKYIKGRPDTNEPIKDYENDEGSVYRSFVDKKMELPAGNRKIFLVETEDHPIEYGKFKGTIPEGYGAGKVELWDKGTFELLEVEGDKKYVFDFHGNKLKGQYAFVRYNTGYLWVKVKDKKASAIDYPKPTLPPQLWDLTKSPPLLKESVKKDIMDNLISAYASKGYKNPFEWITGLYLSGSSTSNIYREKGDVDIDIKYDPDKLKNLYPNLKEISDKELKGLIEDIIYIKNWKNVAGTNHLYAYTVLDPKDFPVSEGVYDIMNNKWLRGPTLIPMDFNPDKAFIVQRDKAEKIAEYIDIINGKIVRSLDTLKKIDEYQEGAHGDMEAQKSALIKGIKKLCLILRILEQWIKNSFIRSRETENPVYPAFNYSPDWEQNTIVLKYLARSGYHSPFKILTKLINDSPYLKLIRQFQNG